MTSDRPYQAAVASEQAILELRRCAGTRFAPDVIDVLCEEIAAGRLGDGVDDLDLEFPTLAVPDAEAPADGQTAR